MSDNISADEVKRRLVIFLRIPAEVWTDILKLLPRRILVQNISPVCFRLKEICNKNVKNIHVIKNAGQFCYILKEDDPEANQQLEHLAGNNCHLAGQFRMTRYLSITDEKSQAILRHCPDLVNGCRRILLRFYERNKSSTVFLECLTELAKAKPVAISVFQNVDQVIDFWHHPTFLNCTRVRLLFWSSLSAATMISTFVNVFNWLHHRQPTDGIDSDGNGNAAADQQVRYTIVQLRRHQSEHVDWLLDRCSQDIQQAHGPADRHPYVFSFLLWVSEEWPGFGQELRHLRRRLLRRDRCAATFAPATFAPTTFAPATFAPIF